MSQQTRDHVVGWICCGQWRKALVVERFCPPDRSVGSEQLEVSQTCRVSSPAASQAFECFCSSSSPRPRLKLHRGSLVACADDMPLDVPQPVKKQNKKRNNQPVQENTYIFILRDFLYCHPPSWYLQKVQKGINMRMCDYSHPCACHTFAMWRKALHWACVRRSDVLKLKYSIQALKDSVELRVKRVLKLIQVRFLLFVSQFLSP